MTAWEKQIANNPVALSPLLLKRAGLLTVEIAAWCEQGCGFVDALAKELKVVRPNVFDRRPCAAELLGKQLEALLALGLPSLAVGGDGVTPEQRFAADFQNLLQSLVNDFLELAHKEIELHLSSFALRVEREEPDGCSEDFDALKARRDLKARAFAKSEFQKLPLSRSEESAASPTQGPFLRQWLLNVVEAATASSDGTAQQEEAIPEDAFKQVLTALAKQIDAFNRLRSEAVAGLVERLKDVQQRASQQVVLKDAESAIAELVDRTLLLFRVEVLKDVVEANYRPSVETSPIRPDQVANALNDIKRSLQRVGGGDDFVKEYCLLMFKERRVEVFRTLLIGASVTPASTDRRPLGAQPRVARALAAQQPKAIQQRLGGTGSLPRYRPGQRLDLLLIRLVQSAGVTIIRAMVANAAVVRPPAPTHDGGTK